MKTLFVDGAPKAVGPYCHAVVSGELIYTSGQLPIDPLLGSMPSDIAQQTKQSLENVKTILESQNSDLSKVIKTTVLLSDINNFAEMNVVYAEMFGDHTPARTCYQVAALPLGALVEIEVIAEK